MVIGKWKRGSPRGSRLKSVNECYGSAPVIYTEFSRWPPFEREPIRSFGDKRRVGRLGL